MRTDHRGARLPQLRMLLGGFLEDFLQRTLDEDVHCALLQVRHAAQASSQAHLQQVLRRREHAGVRRRAKGDRNTNVNEGGSTIGGVLVIENIGRS